MCNFACNDWNRTPSPFGGFISYMKQMKPMVCRCALLFLVMMSWAIPSLNNLMVTPFTVRTICIYPRFHTLKRFPIDFIIKVAINLMATRFWYEDNHIFSRKSPWQNFNVLSIHIALFCFYYSFVRTWIFCSKIKFPYI